MLQSRADALAADQQIGVIEPRGHIVGIEGDTGVKQGLGVVEDG